MKIKVAAVQLHCELCNVDANLALSEKLLNEAVEKGAQWVIFPELFNTGYQIPEQDREMAEEVPNGKTTQWMIAMAKKHQILISGCILTKGDSFGVVKDTCLTVSEKGVLDTYDKIHLFGPEELRFENGSRLAEPIKYGDLSIGMQICYEIGFPDLSRVLVLKGANVLIYPAAFGRKRYYVWDIQSKARALENGCYVIAINHVGEEADVKFYGGHSRIVDPHGTVLCEASLDKDEVIVAEIDVEECLKARDIEPYLRDLNKPMVKQEWSKL